MKILKRTSGIGNVGTEMKRGVLQKFNYPCARNSGILYALIRWFVA
jgi:hypothetical protein